MKITVYENSEKLVYLRYEDKENSKVIYNGIIYDKQNDKIGYMDTKSGIKEENLSIGESYQSLENIKEDVQVKLENCNNAICESFFSRVSNFRNK